MTSEDIKRMQIKVWKENAKVARKKRKHLEQIRKRRDEYYAKYGKEVSE